LLAQYCSMVPWWSRWSSSNPVNTATSACTPSTRPTSSAIDDASTTALRAPWSTIQRSSRCSSGASGVVSAVSRCSRPTRAPSVVTTPAHSPVASSAARTSVLVVVFPLLPVTATRRSSSAGSPASSAPSGPRTARTDGTVSCGADTGSGRSVSSAAAPAARAVAAKRWPSLAAPRTQANSEPGVTARESLTRV
jgi:hypothetical protein